MLHTLYMSTVDFVVYKIRDLSEIIRDQGSADFKLSTENDLTLLSNGNEIF